MLTVVVWDDGAGRVKAVGPTASGAASLDKTVRQARAIFDHAEVVPWWMREASPAVVIARVAGPKFRIVVRDDEGRVLDEDMADTTSEAEQIAAEFRVGKNVDVEILDAEALEDGSARSRSLRGASS